jgi:hypothetical protein
MNPRLAATVTANSAAETEPITRRGSRRPVESSDGVATGPQPPPPVASTNPANRPSGARKAVRGRTPSVTLGCLRNTNRLMM